MMNDGEKLLLLISKLLEQKIFFYFIIYPVLENHIQLPFNWSASLRKYYRECFKKVAVRRKAILHRIETVLISIILRNVKLKYPDKEVVLHNFTI